MPFFFIGFALAEFMGLTTMMVTFIAALVAILLYNYQSDSTKKLTGGEA